MVKAIVQVMVSELWKEIQAKLKLALEDVNDLGINIIKILDRLSVSLNGIENNMQSAVISEAIGQQSSDVNVILDGCNGLSNEMDLRFSTATDPIETVEQNHGSDFTPALTVQIS